MMNTAEIKQLLPKTHKKEYAGWILLLIAFGIGWRLMYWSKFIDEAETITIAELITQGSLLYRDVFSHHFPFSYYWLALFIGVFGKSIFIARLSILLFQLFAFIIAMQLSRHYLTVGVTALIWSIVKYFYLGNMAVYSSFAGVSLLTILVIALSILQQEVTPTWKHWLGISIFSAISFLSDPLTIYPITVTLIFIFFKTSSHGIKVIFAILSILSLYAGLLFLTNSLQYFWSDAVLFNSSIYAKYTDANPIRFSKLLYVLISGLGIIDSHLLTLDLLRPMRIEFEKFDQWLFTGFLYRFSIMACVIFMLIRKHFRGAFFLYFFAASTLIINTSNFRSQPYVMVAIFSIAMIVTGSFSNCEFHHYWKRAQQIVRIVVTMLLLWLTIRVLSFAYVNRQHISHDAVFSVFEKHSRTLQNISCHQPDTLLAFYPSGDYLNWFSDMKPVSKYIFMWPWMAEVGLDEVINKLNEPHILALVVREDSIVWETIDFKEPLRPLDIFLNENYHTILIGKSKIYLSPELKLRCSSKP